MDKNFAKSFHLCVGLLEILTQISSTTHVTDEVMSDMLEHLDFVVTQLKGELSDQMLAVIGVAPAGFVRILNQMPPEDKKVVIENVFDCFTTRLDTLNLLVREQDPSISPSYRNFFEKAFFSTLRHLNVEPPEKIEMEIEIEEKKGKKTFSIYDWQQLREDVMKAVGV